MKLEQITSIITDYVANGSFASLKENAKYVDKKEGYARVIRLTDENNNYSDADSIYVTKKSYNFLSKSKLNAKDIIVTNVGAYLGTVFQCPNLDIPMTLGPNAILIKPNDNVLNDYLYYLLYSNYGHNKLLSLVNGSAMPKFNKTDLKRMDVEIHDIKSQQHIVDTIGSIDDLIEQKEIENRKINQLIQLIFIKNTKQRDKIRIGDLNGYKIIKSGIEEFDCQKIYLDTASVDKYGISSRDYLITKDNKPSRANMQPIPKSVWFAKLKDSPKYLFVQDYMNEILNNYIFSTGFLGLEGDTRFIANYLYALVISEDFDTQKNSLSIGATMQGINNDSFKEILVPNLTIDEMNVIGETLDNLLIEIYNNNLKIKQLNEMKQLYLKKFFG